MEILQQFLREEKYDEQKRTLQKHIGHIQAHSHTHARIVQKSMYPSRTE